MRDAEPLAVPIGFPEVGLVWSEGRRIVLYLRRMAGWRYTIPLAGCAVALTVLAFSDVAIVDDAYISFRYARNFASGEGLVFNPGEYVEGYSNLLWTLAMALPEALGLSVRHFAAFLGLAFGLLALLESWRICRLLGLSAWGTGAAVVALGAYPSFWLGVTIGLEGGLFAFLLALCARLAVSGRPLATGIVGGLLFATRPESALLAPVFVAFLARGADYRRGVALLAPWLALAATLTAWRLYYYGALVPNTVTAKSPPGPAAVLAGLPAGVEYVAGFCLSAAPLVLGGLLAVRSRNPAVYLCLACFAAEVLAVLANGGDWMSHYRLLSVFAPLLAVVLGVAVEGLKSSGRTLRLGIGIVLVGSVLPMLWWSWWDKNQDVWFDASPDAEVKSPLPVGCYGAISDAVAPVLGPADVVAPEALGEMGYLLPAVHVHDMWGLTDRELAEHGSLYYPTVGKADPARTYYVARPNLVVTHNRFGFHYLMDQQTDKAYTRTYRTYFLDGLRSNGCEPSEYGFEYVVGVRRGDADRLLPALAPLEPRPAEVPG